MIDYPTRCPDQLRLINQMYQFSLDWCGAIYMSSIDNSEKFDNIATRINEIKSHFTINLLESVCQGLFEDDKGLLAFLFAVNAANVTEKEFMLFLKSNGLKVGDSMEMLDVAKNM